MSNSNLVTYRAYTNNYDQRKHSIDKITIHHMAGNLTVQTCCNVLNNAGSSVNYCIDNKLQVGMQVPEDYRAWTSCSESNDTRAVTIELANDEVGGNWHVSDAVMNKCIDLCVDICKRNGIKRINYTGDASGNLTFHYMFWPTACPGPYVKSRAKWIQDEINKRLGEEPSYKGIAVDGWADYETTKALQKYLGTPQDGIISGQNPYMKEYLPNFTSIEYDYGGSLLVIALQKELSRQGFQTDPDGYLGPDTVKSLQRYMNKWWGASLSVDGVAGPLTITYLQRFLNYKLYGIK